MANEEKENKMKLSYKIGLFGLGCLALGLSIFTGLIVYIIYLAYLHNVLIGLGATSLALCLVSFILFGVASALETEGK